MHRGPAAAAAQLPARDLQHLDPVRAQVGVRRLVALVGDDDAGRDGQRVAPVVPLLALGRVDVLVGGQDPDLRQSQRGGDRVVHPLRGVVGDRQLLLRVARLHRVGGQHPEAGVLGERAGVDHGHHGVEVHHRPGRREPHRDHPRHLPAREQLPGEALDPGCGRPLAHPDQHRTLADDEDVAALGRRDTVRRAGRPHREARVGEQGVPAVDRLVVRRLPDPCQLLHAVDRHAGADPGRGVARVEVVGQRLQHEVVGPEGVQDDGTRLGDAVEQLALGDAGDRGAR